MDISSLLEVQVNEVQTSTPLEAVLGDVKSPVDNLKPCEIVGLEEQAFFKFMFQDDIAQVRFRRLHCTACDVHIGSAPYDAQNMQEHPMLKTLLCSSCRIFYGDGEFEQGDDATDMFCRWCANGGNLYCCSYCSNTFCDKCIQRNFDEHVRAKIEADDKWKCFVCDPKELYTHRAVCRALLQHIRILARIIMADRTMTQREIEQKMELDDSKCCVGRRKRKRHPSTSDDENDEDYNVGDDHHYATTKRRIRNGSRKRRKSSTSSTKDHTNEHDQSGVAVNGKSRYIPIASKYANQSDASDKTKNNEPLDDIPPPFLQCEQIMIECENQRVTPQGIVLPASQENTKIPDAILNNHAISLNPIPRQALVRTPQGHTRQISLRPLQKVSSIPPGATIHRLPVNVPMVTIPSRTSMLSADSPQSTSKEKGTNQSSNYLRLKSNLTRTPNVINIDSDTEELTVVESTSASSSHRNSTDDSATATLSKDSRFGKAMDHPLKMIDTILEKFRERLKIDFDAMDNLIDSEVLNNCQKLKIINNHVDKIMNELAGLNNSMVKKYKLWKKCHENDESFDDSTKLIILKKNEKSSTFTPLDMECVRDSESDNESEDDDSDITAYLDFSNRIIKINDFKDFISQGSLAKVETEDKGIQVYDIPVSEDFDKTISYSLLMSAYYNTKTNKEVFKPTLIQDKNFGKYEEQFIFYLQHFEDQRNIENAENSNDNSEVSLTTLIDADFTRQNEIQSVDEADENDVLDKSNTITADESIHENNELSVCRDKSLSDDIENMGDIHEELKENIEQNNADVGTVKENRKIDETVIAVNALIEDEKGDEHVKERKELQGNEECTILE